MKLGIMQPYFLPYVGYFQLMAAVDTFVIYDRIQYTKRGWINRNRLLRNGEAVTFSLPVAKGSDRLDIRERSIAENFEARKLLAQFEGAYRKAPNFDQGMALVERILANPERNLFGFLHASLRECHAYLGLSCDLVVSSAIESDDQKTGQDRVLGICRDMGATRYINPIGGTELYDAGTFRAEGIDLRFLKSGEITYQQFGGEFVPGLSILDVIMFNDPDRIRAQILPEYELITND